MTTTTRRQGEPTQTCHRCGRAQVVRPDARGFPPDIAKRRLQKLCEAAGCPCEPMYTAGFDLTTRRVEDEGLTPEQMDRDRDEAEADREAEQAWREGRDE